MLNLPLDFERMPEFWQLKETLRTAWMESSYGYAPRSRLAIRQNPGVRLPP